MTGTGTLINALFILLGGLVGLTLANRLTEDRQKAIKGLLGVLVVFVGLSTTWDAFRASPSPVWKQLLVMMLALMLGNFTGSLLRFQRGLNHLGRYARERFTQAGPGGKSVGPIWSEGFITCSLLFCVGPIAILGSLQDGLTGNFKTLAIKGLMDGLATMGFVSTFGWGVIFSVIPVVAYQGTLTLLAKSLAPLFENVAMLESINAVGGLIVFCIALIILNLKKVELANYLPSLLYAPLLTWWWG